MTTCEHLIRELIEPAATAGRRIMDIRRDSLDVRIKTDGSPITRADLESENILIAALTRIAPDIPIVSEETRPPPDIGTRFWLLDPLDGTKSFIDGAATFSINIGLIEAQKPILGLLHLPSLCITYLSCGTGTARRIDAKGSETSIHVRRPPPEGLTVLTSQHHADQARESRFWAGRTVVNRQGIGGACKFGLIAEGAADMYVRFGQTGEWDTAAGQAIVEAAGGTVACLDGSPLTYGKSRYLNTGFVVKGG
ncbi:MAG: 3'(2'),5'-bisphosphate nucleotidase CysQ [Pseudomonadota bacterium]|nr:3'(2'),5'-bisphosphate nucleotidase CysQ [Pseudomonadota bacterium]